MPNTLHKPKELRDLLAAVNCAFTQSLWLLAVFYCARWGGVGYGASYYPQRLEDAKAIYLSGPTGTNDTPALQQAIDQAASAGQGIVFIAPGRYQITDTIYIWPSVRVIGNGETRPVLALPARTAGFMDASQEKQLFYFAGGRPRPGRGGPNAESRPSRVPDANPGTFYSALANVDVIIEEGNLGAVGARAHYAQHCFISHVDFHLGPALAGIHEAGNVVEDVRFLGGKYGIWTGKPSPSWQFTVIDSYFEGQSEAAIREKEAGLTLIRPHFVRVPTAIAIEPDEADELWVKDARFEEISGPALVFGLEKNPRNEINLEGVSCRQVPVFAALRESGRQFKAPGTHYMVKTFSHGLRYDSLSQPPAIKTAFDAAPVAAMPSAVPSDLPPLPPATTWANIREFGAKGDGVTDDTEAIKKAVATRQALYFPMGFYVVRDTILLRPDTVLIGLHPGATQLTLPDGTPAYAGIGAPKALLETPAKGSNIVIGIGLYTSGNNPRAVAALWKAGANSLMNDVRFLGGHGTPKPDGGRENPYNNTHSSDPDPNRHWDSQYPSLWVTDGGGGTFLDLWTPSTFAQAGMLVSDTETEGRVYQMSSEHHVRYEVQLRRAANWRFYALQTEEERGESGFALPLEIESCRNLTFANFHLYRVISCFQPFPYAVKVTTSEGIRFRNFHCYSNSKVSFDAAVRDETRGLEIRPREFAWQDLTGPASKAAPATCSLVARGAKAEKLAGGFYNISGGTTGPGGDFYFVDSRWQRIYRWSAGKRQLATVSDFPLEPVNLAVDQSGNLLAVSYAGKGIVYGLPKSGGMELVKPATPTALAKASFFLPDSDWHFNRESLSQPAAHFVSPDGTAVIVAGEDFLQGATSWGVKSSPPIRSFGLVPYKAGQTAYVSDESGLVTWAGEVGADGRLQNIRRFVEQGSESAVADAQGNVFLAAGQILVYRPNGEPLGQIDVPERPTHLAFGGPDGKTLFICARTSLYAVRLRHAGH